MQKKVCNKVKNRTDEVKSWGKKNNNKLEVIWKSKRNTDRLLKAKTEFNLNSQVMNVQ